METRFYYVSRKHFVFFLMFATALLGCSLWLVGEVIRDPSLGSFANRIPALVFSCTFCLIFTICVRALVRQIRSIEPTVTLDSDGITLSRGVSDIKAVSWAQITGTRILDQPAGVVGRLRHLVIDVKNSDDLLNTIPNRLERAIARLNAASIRSPICISSEMVSEPLKDLQLEIECRLYEHRRLTAEMSTVRDSGTTNPEPLRVANR